MHTTGSELQRVGLKGIIPHLALNGAIIGLADRGSTLFGPEEFLLARGVGFPMEDTFTADSCAIVLHVATTPRTRWNRNGYHYV